MSTPIAIVQKRWDHCDVVGDDGLSYGGVGDGRVGQPSARHSPPPVRPPKSPRRRLVRGVKVANHQERHAS